MADTTRHVSRQVRRAGGRAAAEPEKVQKDAQAESLQVQLAETTADRDRLQRELTAEKQDKADLAQEALLLLFTPQPTHGVPDSLGQMEKR